MSPTQRSRRRSRQRGAAIVEATVMFLFITPFFGFNLFIYETYKNKIDVQQTTRESAMYYASHACKEQTPSPKAPKAGAGTTSESGNDVNKSPNAPQVLTSQPSTNAVFSGLGGAFINASETSQSAGITVFGHNNTVHSKSYTLCNEELWGGTFAIMTSLLGFFSFGLKFFASMIGGYIQGLF